MCLLDAFVAVLPAELESITDDFLHQLKGLLDLGARQRSEVNNSHVHLHMEGERERDTNTHINTPYII